MFDYNVCLIVTRLYAQKLLVGYTYPYGYAIGL